MMFLLCGLTFSRRFTGLGTGTEHGEFCLRLFLVYDGFKHVVSIPVWNTKR